VRKADNLPLSCAVVTKSGNPDFLEPSGPVQVCNGNALPFSLPAFQVQALICTVIQVQTLKGLHIGRFLVVNYLIRKTVGGVKVVMALSNLSPDKTYITCLVGRSFATECV